MAPEIPIIRTDLQSLSRIEREQVWADLLANPHNTSYQVNSEEPQFVSKCINDLQNLLLKDIKLRDPNSNMRPPSAFEVAYRQDSNYVTDPKFLLMFLRGNLFDLKSAAKHILYHLELKKKLFGGELLTKDITIGDITQLEQTEACNEGQEQQNQHQSHLWYHQQSSHTTSRQPFSKFMRFIKVEKGRADWAGRQIIFVSPSHCPFDLPPKYILRQSWESHMSTARMKQHGENAQKVGCVAIISLLDEYPSNMNYEHFRQLVQIDRASPLRIVSLYILRRPNGAASPANGNNETAAAWNNLIDFLIFVMGKLLRVRTRTITGSPQECVYNLLCLGFTEANIPIELKEQSLLQSPSPNTAATMETSTAIPIPPDSMVIEDD